MNSNAFVRIVVTFAIMILALWMSLDIFAGGSNSLGKFYFYVMLASGVFGLLSPKKAFYYLIFLAAYLDFFKRLMILDHGIRMFDLYWVLGIAPATMAGITVSVLYQLSFGGHRIRPLEGRLVVITLVLFALLFAVGMVSLGRNFRAVGDLVNTAIYMPLVFVLPFLFREPGEVQKVIKFMIYLFVPSALYLVYQSFFGLAWWEHRYLQSGLSIEARQYGEKVFRCFGTMAGAAGATIFYSLFAAILLGSRLWHYRRDGSPTNHSQVMLRFTLAAVYMIAAYRTFSRTGWVLALIVLICLFAFRYRILIATIYTTLAVAVVAVILLADFLLKHQVLNKIDIEMRSSSDEARQASQLATLNGRLEGFYALTHNKKIWTPFGLRFAGKGAMLQSIWLHDALTDAVVRLGYIPLGLFLIAVSFLLRYLHRFILDSPPGLARNIAVLGLASFVGLSLGGVTSGTMFVVFPQNMLLYLCLGSCVAMIVHARTVEHDAEVAERPPQSPRRPTPYRPASRRPAYA